MKFCTIGWLLNGSSHELKWFHDIDIIPIIMIHLFVRQMVNFDLLFDLWPPCWIVSNWGAYTYEEVWGGVRFE